MRKQLAEPFVVVAGFFIFLGAIIFLSPQLDSVTQRLGIESTAQVQGAFGTGKTWQVGPTREYKKPSQVAPLVADGDTVEIDAGVYECDTGVQWRKNNLTLKGVGGRAHLKAEGCSIPGGKGIWNPTAQNLRIENIEFSGARVGDRNGAGIRHDGGGEVIITNSYFHDNQNGILFTPNPAWANDTTLTIEYSEFAHNGYGDGQSHNLYINAIGKLIFRYNYSHHADVGHLLKSRARENYILYNRLVDLSDGNASYNIDIPDGGLTYIIGNILHQGPQSENRGIIAYGAEGWNQTPTRDNRLFVINNTFHNTNPGASEALKLMNGQGLPLGEAKLINNLFVGLTQNLLVTYNPQKATLTNNQIVDDSGFGDIGSFNYYLKSGSAAIDAGVNPGSDSGFSLVPIEQYLHSANKERRSTAGAAIDLGAYEYTGSNVEAPTLQFSTDATTINYNSTVRLTWSANNAQSCIASGGWSGGKSASGSEVSKALTFNETFSIRCDGRGGSVSQTISVTVRENPTIANFADYVFERIPNTKIRPLCQRGFPFEGTTGCDGKGGWSTSEYVPTNNTLYLVGGGSRNYFGNEVFSLNLTNKTLSKVFGPTDPRDTTNYNPNNTWGGDVIGTCSGVWDLKNGGTVPAPLQPYTAFMHLPGINKIYMHGGQVACGVSANTTAGWMWNPVDSSWQLLYRSSAGPAWSHGAYLPDKDLAVVVGSEGFFRYNPSTNTLSKLTGASAPYAFGGLTAVYDPRSQLLMFMGFYNNEEHFSVIDVSNLNAQSTTVPPRETNWTILGDTTLLRRVFPGLSYDSRNRHLVGWDGSDKIYFIEPDKQTKTVTFVAKRLTGNPTATGAIVGNFRYIPTLKAFALFSDVDEDFFLLKETRPGSGNPIPPPPAPPPVPIPPAAPAAPIPPPQAAAPSCSLAAIPASVEVGSTVRLQWSTQHASSVVISPSIGNVAVEGERIVKPAASGAYTLTAVGSGGTKQCTANVTVRPISPAPDASAQPLTCSLTVTPASVEAGEKANLRWNVKNASSVSIDKDIGTVSLEGEREIDVPTSVTYTLIASRGTENITCFATGHARVANDTNQNSPSSSSGSSSGGGGGSRSSRGGVSSGTSSIGNSSRSTFTKTINVGAEDAEVAKLQEVLSKDTTLYPEGLITGYYGSLTQLAIFRLQIRHGIKESDGYGYVGPKTRAKLNELAARTPSTSSGSSASGAAGSVSAPSAQIPSSIGGGSGGGSFTKTLSPGTSDTTVSLLQRFLATDPTMYPEASVTGYYGPATERAVKRFQARFGIVSGGTPETTGYGRVGPATLSKLNQIYGNLPVPPIPASSASNVTVVAASSALPSTPPASAVVGGVLFDRSLKIGDVGDDVSKLQLLLAKDPTIYPEGNITGTFTPLTELTVRKFQRTYGLVSSGDPATTGYGVVGPRTQAKLLEVFGR